MSQLVIEIDSPDDEALVRQLLNRLNVRILTADGIQKQNRALAQIAGEIADRGGVTSFGDASEWQREIRGWDRVLNGREE